jgi:integrative and conjugative element protein (TIGR02256 family)
MMFSYDGKQVELSAACLETLDANRQRTRLQKETGGQLFATFRPHCIYVECATCIRGARSRFSFRPDRAEEQREIEALFNKGLHYVGDWHTHPEDAPSPSQPDCAKALGIYSESQHQLTFMLMAIVGRRPFPEGLFLAAINAEGVRRLGA